jgi:hypothetical protein
MWVSFSSFLTCSVQLLINLQTLGGNPMLRIKFSTRDSNQKTWVAARDLLSHHPNFLLIMVCVWKICSQTQGSSRHCGMWQLHVWSWRRLRRWKWGLRWRGYHYCVSQLAEYKRCGIFVLNNLVVVARCIYLWECMSVSLLRWFVSYSCVSQLHSRSSTELVTVLGSLFLSSVRCNSIVGNAVELFW